MIFYSSKNALVFIILFISEIGEDILKEAENFFEESAENSEDISLPVKQLII